MTIWDTMDAALAADTNLGVAAELQHAGGAWQAVRIIPAAPFQDLPGLAPARAGAQLAMLPAASLAAAPVRGDLLRWDATTWRVEAAEPDAAATTYRLTLATT